MRPVAVPDLRDVYSQNGEDGVIGWIFDRIGEGGRTCCEFGAWDGLHFSNTRLLIEQGWSAILFEASERRFVRLVENVRAFPDVRAYRRLVDASVLDAVIAQDAPNGLDLLVVDIDGRDFDVVSEMSVSPRVICVEVNAGHDPSSAVRLDGEVAARNVGQPFGAFHDVLTGRGYQLVEYTGNAFYVRATELLPALTPPEAYAAFLERLSPEERGWLYHVNRGEVAPYHVFGNELLSPPSLRDFHVVPRWRRAGLRARARLSASA